MNQENRNSADNKQKFFNLTLAAMAGQVGCLTLIIIFGALLGGIWLDNTLQTKPWFTIGLLLVSVPVSLIIMFVVARKAISKIKTGPVIKDENKSEEAGLGRDT